MPFKTYHELMARHAAQRRIMNMRFVYMHRWDTRMCRKLLASPPGSYVTMELCLGNT